MDAASRDAPDFGPLDAARAIRSAQEWGALLRQRMEGLTWMLWGVVAAAAFLSYAFAAREHAPAWVRPVLWIPWVAGGNVITVVSWRFAARARPGWPRPAVRDVALLIGAFLAVFTLQFLALRPTSWTVPMLLAGAVWAAMGLLVPGMTRRGTRVGLAIGALTASAALALAAAGLPEPAGAVAASALVGVIPFAGGTWHALRE